MCANMMQHAFPLSNNLYFMVHNLITMIKLCVAKILIDECEYEQQNLNMS